jgi:hypothetical protein
MRRGGVDVLFDRSAWVSVDYYNNESSIFYENYAARDLQQIIDDVSGSTSVYGGRGLIGNESSGGHSNVTAGTGGTTTSSGPLAGAPSTAGGVTADGYWEPPLEEPLRGGFSDLLRQLDEWASLPPYVTKDGREIPYVTGMPPLPGGVGRVGALRQLVVGEENIRRFASLNAARAAARQYAGLGDDAVNFVQEIGPLTGRVTGRMSRDGLRGWRIDFDPRKGFHVNWWDRTGGTSRADWKYGANVIEGGTLDDFWAIMQHFP